MSLDKRINDSTIQVNQIISFREEIGRKDRVQRNRYDCLFGLLFGFAGDNAVETNQGLYLVYMHAGTNPFEVISQAVK